MNSLDRMKELIIILQEASKAYYAEDREIMSNFEYDKLYDELVKLEEETGTTLAGSPTISVGFEAVDELPKETHESPMLSLGKTKDREELKDWFKKSGLTINKFFNTSGVLYREMQLKDKVKTLPEDELIDILAINGMLVKRPIVINGDTVLVGFKEDEWNEKLK